MDQQGNILPSFLKSTLWQLQKVRSIDSLVPYQCLAPSIPMKNLSHFVLGQIMKGLWFELPFANKEFTGRVSGPVERLATGVLLFHHDNEVYTLAYFQA
jgi:hypothetical protein